MSPSMLLAIAAGSTLLAAAVTLWAVSQRRSLRNHRARLEDATRNLEFLQRAFSRFAPAAVVEEIIADGFSVAPEKKDVTILFADLQGFTTMSERLDPGVLVQVLNGYFDAMSRAISAHTGHVSKFIGDGILALFGAVEPNPWQCQDACRAAIAMREALDAYNQELVQEGLPRLRVGIGVHHGAAVAGVIGSEQLMEYTVIGSTVNLAARVESMTRVHGVDILVTEPVKEALDARFELDEMPPTEAKGVSGLVKTYALVSLDGAIGAPRRADGS